MPSLARFRVSLSIETNEFGQSNGVIKRAIDEFTKGASSQFVEFIPNPAALKELDRKLAGLTVAARGKALRAAVTKGIKPALAAARQAIPVGTVEHKTYKGRLVTPGFARKNVATNVRVSKDKTAATAELGVRPEAFYATEFVELGTSRMAAQPWLVPSFNSTASEQIAAASEALKAAIEKAATS